MQEKKFIKIMQKKVSYSSLSPSALRGQVEGTLGILRTYCSNIVLSEFTQITQDEFNEKLDTLINDILEKHPNIFWGAARKAINLFLRDCLYNNYLSDKYDLDSIKDFLEIPLDSIVSGKLYDSCGDRKLPKWKSLKELNEEESKIYQNCAQLKANECKIERIHLDMVLWLEGKK